MEGQGIETPAEARFRLRHEERVQESKERREQVVRL